MISALEQRGMGLRGKGDEHNAVDIGVEDTAAEDVERVADIEMDRAVSGVKLQFANHNRVNEFERVSMGVVGGLACSRAWAGYGRTAGSFRECAEFQSARRK